jgi:hypothetical protein
MEATDSFIICSDEVRPQSAILSFYRDKKWRKSVVCAFVKKAQESNAFRA